MAVAPPLPPGLDGLWTLPGVYAPQADTHLLARALGTEPIGPHTHVLDLCTGSGALALLAARRGARVCATDLSWRAVVSARINAARAGQRVRVLRGDLSGPVRGQRFEPDREQPPYVPDPAARTSPRRDRSHAASLAWDAGPGGRHLVDRVCAHAGDVLSPRGVLLLVHSAMCRAEETLRRLGEAGLRAEVAERCEIPFGPVTRARLAWLRAEGLLDAGARTEELVVIRAERA
ncbi:methyltransferase [Streptomyces sp. SPB78]|uniref:methyltransferase n=1 Tax=Streptomyces sp. (strain SPB78) TaxID=591157 RepID=UPI0001B55E50|nr:methyltransferase [Streptomyces sp. SPB78]